MKSFVHFNSITALGLLILLVFTSCSRSLRPSGNVVSEVRNVNNFYKVEAEGSFKVFLTQDSKQEVVIKADDNLISHIRTHVRDGKLYIDMDRTRIRDWNATMEIHIKVPDLKEAKLEGSGNIKTENTFKTSELEFEIEGSGRIDGNFEGNKLEAKIKGSGDIYLYGRSDEADFEVDGAGNIEGFGIQTRTTEANIHGSGNCQVSVSDRLEARVNGSGNIYYKGTPAISTAINGSGRIEQR